MSYADRVFVSMCNDILTNGTDTKGEAVRPHWEDGSSAYTIKKFGVINRYDLRKEFPILTLRKTPIKTAVKELLWIWQKKSNNIKDLDAHIWDSWADESGSIGRAYGYQIGCKYAHHKLDNSTSTLENGFPIMEYDVREYPSLTFTSYYINGEASTYVKMDQIDSVIWDLKHNPFSRRIMTNIYNFNDLKDMHLYPCAYSCTFNVTNDKRDDEKLTLNMILNQRSQDVLAANAFNVVQYSVLLCMIAQVCGMVPGEFVHVISDCHIYDRHIDIIKELITREQYDAPKFWLNPEIKNFYDFTVDDIHLEDYICGEQIKNIPVAI